MLSRLQYSKGVVGLNNSNEPTEEKREEITQEELNKNPYVLDYQNEIDLISDYGWSVLGILSFITFIGGIVFKYLL